MNTFLDTLARKETSHVPFWFMRQAGRYLPEYRKLRESAEGFLDLCYTPEKATEVTLQPIRRFGMSGAILFSDILVVPHALGRDVRFVKGEGPQLDPLTKASQLDALKMDGFDDVAGAVYQTVKNLRGELGEETALIGFAGAPWTVACYMVEGRGVRDFPQTRELAYRDSAFFGALMERITDATIHYLKKQIEAGAQAIQLFDTWAGIAPPVQLKKWVFAPHAKIVKALKAEYPHVPIIGFPKGIGEMLEHYVEEVQPDGLSIDMQTSIKTVRDRLSDKVVLQGNLDPLLLVADKEAAVKDTRYILDQMKEVPFIFNLGHGIVPHTPIEHVEAVSETIKAFRRN